jgi:type I restriction enzyme S subunit
MAAVDERLGVISRAETRPFAELRKGYTYFEEGDVLFARITPCMQNGKHAIAHGLIGGFGFGTTEFHVLRPGSETIPEWIHFFLRQPAVLREATAHFAGAVGQQRVPQGFLASLEIPLPPVRGQERIAAIVKEQMAAVERARVAAQARLEAAKAPTSVLASGVSRPGSGRESGSVMFSALDRKLCILTLSRTALRPSWALSISNPVPGDGSERPVLRWRA